MLVEDVKKSLVSYKNASVGRSEKVQALQILKVYLLVQLMTGQLTASRHCDLEAIIDYYIYQLLYLSTN